MGILARIRTRQLLAQKERLRDEHTRFVSYLEAAFESPAVTAILSNYVHQEEQDFRRQNTLHAADAAFDIAWAAAVSAYEDFPGGDSTVHGYFLALLKGTAPYEKYDYRDLLNHEQRVHLIDRMINLVSRG